MPCQLVNSCLVVSWVVEERLYWTTPTLKVDVAGSSETFVSIHQLTQGFIFMVVDGKNMQFFVTYHSMPLTFQPPPPLFPTVDLMACYSLSHHLFGGSYFLTILNGWDGQEGGPNLLGVWFMLLLLLLPPPLLLLLLLLLCAGNLSLWTYNCLNRNISK